MQTVDRHAERYFFFVKFFRHVAGDETLNPPCPLNPPRRHLFQKDEDCDVDARSRVRGGAQIGRHVGLAYVGRRAALRSYGLEEDDGRVMVAAHRIRGADGVVQRRCASWCESVFGQSSARPLCGAVAAISGARCAAEGTAPGAAHGGSSPDEAAVLYERNTCEIELGIVNLKALEAQL